MANKGIKGITISIGGETTGLQKALSDVNKKSRDLQGELRQVDRLLKFDPGNAELIAQKQELLAEQVVNTTKKLDKLGEAQEQVEKQFKNGEIGAEQYRAFQREIASTEGKLKGLREQISKLDNGSTVNDVKQDMSKLSKESDEAKESVKELGGELSGLVAGLAAGGGIAGAVEKALDTSSLDTTIEISMEVPEESKKSVKDAINTVASYGVDAESALEGVRRQWALNKNASDESNAAVVEGAGAIAKAYSGIDFTELIQETNEISRELNISNEEALGLTNSLLKMGFPPEQLDIIAEYGGQLERAGYNAEEIQAIMSAGVDTGTWNIDNLLDGLKEGRIRVAEFGEEVPDALSDLLEGTELSAKQFQEWGKAVASGGEEGSKAMQEIANALGGVDDETKKNLIGVQVFGTMYEDQGENIIDTLLNAKDATVDLKDNQDLLNGSVSNLDADPAVKMQQAMSDLKVALQPVFEAIANVVAKVAEWASNNPTLVATITAIVTVIGILLGLAMGLVPLFASISAAAGALGISIGALMAPIGIAIAAIAAIIAIGVLLYKNWDTIKAKAIELKDNLVQKFQEIQKQVSEKIESLKRAALQKFQDLKNKVSSLTNSVRTTISNIWNSIKSSVSNTISGMVTTVRGRFQDIVNAVREKMNGVFNKVKEIWGNVTGFFEGINLFSIGANIIQGLINGVGSMAGSLWKKASSLASGIASSISNALDINSPSRVTMELGEYTGEGLALGIEAMTKDIEKASEKMATAAIPNMPKIPKASSISGSGVVSIQPAPLYLDNQLIGEIMFNQMDNQFSNQAQMQLYMKGGRR